MNKAKYSFFLASIILVSCSDSSTENNSGDSSHTVIVDSAEIQDSVVIKSDTNTSLKEELVSVVDWSNSDFIISPAFKSNPALLNTIKYTREEWKDVKSPFVAKYTGCDVGDYFHLTFEEANGKTYDFGNGDNGLGEFTLCNTTDITDNPKYLNKAFNIYWNWKVCSFPCCEGEYEIVEAYVPAITKLELVEEHK